MIDKRTLLPRLAVKEIPFMRVNKNYWLAASGALALASAIMLFSAHRIEAQYSTPVKVLNTSAGPAITSVIDDPGRIPYQAQQSTNVSGTQLGVNFTFPAVPPNHRLVVQRIGGFHSLLSGNTATTSITLTNKATSLTLSTQFTPSVATPSTGNVSQFDLPTLAYFDAGQQPATIAFAGDASVFSGTQISILTGYLIDCSASPCSAIAP
jgi:hypothetical protein